MAEETGSTKRDAPMLNPLERFFERVHNQPEHAAYFAKKITRDVADSLGNHNRWRFGVGHGREVASLRGSEKSKLRSFSKCGGTPRVSARRLDLMRISLRSNGYSS